MTEQAPAPAVSGAGSETYLTASKAKVIGLILAGVLVVGALGGLAGVAFDPEVDSIEDSGPVEAPVGAPNPGAGQHKAFSAPAGVDAAELLAAAAPKGKGKFLKLGNGVQYWVPSGWRVDGTSKTNAVFSSGKGTYAFVATAVVNPKTAAGAVIAGNLKTLLPKANYTQLKVSGPKKWAGAFGSVVSTSYMEYIAMWVDNQGSAPIYGQIYAAVRADGTVLVLLVEHIPPDGWDAAAPTIGNVIYNSFAQFAGVL